MNYQSILIDLLDRAGYQGIDTSIEESLFTYDMVIDYNEDPNYLNTLIHFQDRDGKEYFDFIDIQKEDVINAIEEQKKRFFDYIGISKEEYLKELNETEEYLIYARDIQVYNSWLFDYNSLYRQTIKQTIHAIILEIRRKIKSGKIK